MGETSKMGRPSKFEETMIEEAALLAAAGCTNSQIAQRLNISPSTFKLYRKKFAEFSSAVERGKSIADDMVETALFQRAVGFSAPDVQVVNYKGKSQKVEYTKHYPPDVAACKFWLTNRRPQAWKNRVEVDGLADVAGSWIKKAYDLGVQHERGQGNPSLPPAGGEPTERDSETQGGGDRSEAS